MPNIIWLPNPIDPSGLTSLMHPEVPERAMPVAEMPGTRTIVLTPGNCTAQVKLKCLAAYAPMCTLALAANQGARFPFLPGLRCNSITVTYQPSESQKSRGQTTDDPTDNNAYNYVFAYLDVSYKQRTPMGYVVSVTPQTQNITLPTIGNLRWGDDGFDPKDPDSSGDAWDMQTKAGTMPIVSGQKLAFPRMALEIRRDYSNMSSFPKRLFDLHGCINCDVWREPTMGIALPPYTGLFELQNVTMTVNPTDPTLYQSYNYSYTVKYLRYGWDKGYNAVTGLFSPFFHAPGTGTGTGTGTDPSPRTPSGTAQLSCPVCPEYPKERICPLPIASFSDACIDPSGTGSGTASV